MATKRENNMTSWARIKNDPAARAADRERQRRRYRENAEFRESQKAAAKARWHAKTPEERAAVVARKREQRAVQAAPEVNTAPVKRRQCDTCGDFFAGTGRYCSNSCKEHH